MFGKEIHDKQIGEQIWAKSSYMLHNTYRNFDWIIAELWQSWARIVRCLLHSATRENWTKIAEKYWRLPLTCLSNVWNRKKSLFSDRQQFHLFRLNFMMTITLIIKCCTSLAFIYCLVVRFFFFNNKKLFSNTNKVIKKSTTLSVRKNIFRNI